MGQSLPVVFRLLFGVLEPAYETEAAIYTECHYTRTIFWGRNATQDTCSLSSRMCWEIGSVDVDGK